MDTKNYTPNRYIVSVARISEIPHAEYDACSWCGIPIEHRTHKPIRPHKNWCFVPVVQGAIKFAAENGYFDQRYNPYRRLQCK